MSRQGDHDSRKQQIRAAATRCFVQRGFSATRLLDIAHQAGLSKGGVYFYYNTKEALFDDVLDAHQAQLEARWGDTAGDDEPVDEALERLVVAHLRTIEHEPDETRLSQLLISMAGHDGPFREKLEGGALIVRQLYLAVITRGVDEGVFGGKPDQLADLVLALVQGLAAQSTVEADGRLRLRPQVAARAVLAMLSPDAAVATNTREGMSVVRERESSRPLLQS